jgi:protein-S-isoprenylcysteine O-methyltransferase
MDMQAFVLDNGSTYHIANGTALVEYLITLYFWPSIKTHYGISAFGRVSFLRVNIGRL